MIRNRSQQSAILRIPFIKGFTHIWRMDFPIIIDWMSPRSFLGASGMIFKFIPVYDEIPLIKQNSPRWDAAFCGITSGAILFANVP